MCVTNLKKERGKGKKEKNLRDFHFVVLCVGVVGGKAVASLIIFLGSGHM